MCQEKLISFLAPGSESNLSNNKIISDVNDLVKEELGSSMVWDEWILDTVFAHGRFMTGKVGKWQNYEVLKFSLQSCIKNIVFSFLTP